MTGRLAALAMVVAGAASSAACAAPAAVDRGQPQAVRTALKPNEMLCWVTAVRTDPAGVRIHFNGGGGPLFVGLPAGHWAPDRASSEAQTPDGPFVIARPGDKLSPQNSHHDNCTLEVVRRNGRLGVLATAHLHLPGLEPESASAFMPAVD